MPSQSLCISVLSCALKEDIRCKGFNLLFELIWAIDSLKYCFYVGSDCFSELIKLHLFRFPFLSWRVLIVKILWLCLSLLEDFSGYRESWSPTSGTVIDFYLRKLCCEFYESNYVPKANSPIEERFGALNRWLLGPQPISLILSLKFSTEFKNLLWRAPIFFLVNIFCRKLMHSSLGTQSFCMLGSCVYFSDPLKMDC